MVGAQWFSGRVLDLRLKGRGFDPLRHHCIVSLTGMEYSYLYSYFFSVLSCTLYLANSMSTCTRTYLSTVAKNPVLMSTLRVLLCTFLNFYQIGKKLIVSQTFPPGGGGGHFKPKT